MIKKIALTAFAIVALTMTSCDEDENYVAQELAFEEIGNTPGFGWFDAAFDDYSPNPDTVAKIKTVYNSEEHKLLVFGKPGCSCTDALKDFPKSVKAIYDSDIDFNNCEIWSMNDLTAEHPYEDKITIISLPAFYVFKNGEPIYSVIDSLDYYTTFVQGADGRVETYLLWGLQK
jgi:hypothetical protein